MFVPPGFWSNEMGDIDVIVHDDRLHLFYLCLPSHDAVAHVTSTDGITWQTAPCAIRTGDPGAFDDDQIWTMGVFELDGRFFMLYTGLSLAEAGKVQRVGLAVSDDLVAWHKHGTTPVIEADPRWYDTACDATHRLDWRDPKVFVENGVAHGVICARAKNEASTSRGGCVGYFTSTDGVNWQVKPPLVPSGSFYELETPAVFKLKNRYYLTGIHGHKGGGQLCPSIYRVADSLTGPYRRPANDVLLPGSNMVFKPVEWHEQTLLFHNLRGSGDWPGAENTPVHAVAPPKIADTDGNGDLLLRPFRNWTTVAKTGETTLPDGCCGQQPEDEACPASGFHWQPFTDEYDNFILELDIVETDSPEFGLAFRTDDQADTGCFISLQPGRGQVRLYTMVKSYKNPNAGIIYPDRPQRVIQENTCPTIALGQSHRLRLVAFGPYIEFSLDDRVLISAMSAPRSTGRVGVFSEDGRAAFANVRLTQLSPPDSRACKPLSLTC